MLSNAVKTEMIILALFGSYKKKSLGHFMNIASVQRAFCTKISHESIIVLSWTHSQCGKINVKLQSVFLGSGAVKLLIDNIFIERLG